MRHRKWGGSSAERTVHCPGWAQQSEGIPRDEGGSEYAREGTALHNVMEQILLNGTPRANIAKTFTDTLQDGYTITADHINERILPAYDAWGQLCKEYKITDFETEVECAYADDIGGYADVIAVNDTGDVFVADWKFGMGIQVSPVNSHQGRFYGVAAQKDSCIKDFFAGAKRLNVVIIQPNDRGEDILKIWTTSIDALDEYERVFLDAVEKARSDNPGLCAGGHCKWCPAAAICPEKTGKALWALQYKPDDLEQLSNNMAMVDELSNWIKAVEAAVISQLEVGADVRGWKLVDKRAMTKWRDEALVLKKLARKMHGKKNIMTEKLLSPTQMLKKAKELEVEIDIEPLVHKVVSGTTLAAADDKRDAAVNPRTMAAGLAAIG